MFTPRFFPRRFFPAGYFPPRVAELVEKRLAGIVTLRPRAAGSAGLSSRTRSTSTVTASVNAYTRVEG